jgi:hypothetical protein
MKTKEALIKLIREKFADLSEEELQEILKSIERVKKKKSKKT